MIRRFLILLVVFSSVVLRGNSQIIGNDDILRSTLAKYGQVEVTIPYTDNRTLDYLTRNVSIISVRDKLVHISISPLTIDWFIIQNLDYVIIERAEAKGVVSAVDVMQAMEWNSYPTYSQYDSIMQIFISDYPDLCHLDTIGSSINGKLVLALKISDNAGLDEDEPEVFYSSTMHGDELAGYVLMLRLADYLLKNYSTSDRVRNLVDNLEIWINPLANPDGTYGTGNSITFPTRYNANSVDLNRNFPDPFQPLEIQEKENIDMINFMRGHNFVLSANFHSGYEVVNYPWDRWLSKIHADDSWFYSISRAYADTVHVYSGPSYMNYEDNGITRGAVWYVIYGGRQDFITWELQGREVTVELDLVKETPAAQLELLWLYNWRSLMGYLENALYGIHGRVLDAISSEPVAARVFITGHDKDSSHVYSDNLAGSFVRLLSPGSWNLSFSANGYRDTTFTNINVFSGQKTDILVYMVPSINSVESVITESPVIYPNPARTEIKAVLPDGMTGAINVRIINQSGKVLSDYNVEVDGVNPLIINVTDFPGGTYSVVFTHPVTKTVSRGRIIVIK